VEASTSTARVFSFAEKNVGGTIWKTNWSNADHKILWNGEQSDPCRHFREASSSTGRLLGWKVTEKDFFPGEQVLTLERKKNGKETLVIKGLSARVCVRIDGYESNQSEVQVGQTGVTISRFAFLSVIFLYFSMIFHKFSMKFHEFLMIFHDLSMIFHDLSMKFYDLSMKFHEFSIKFHTSFWSNFTSFRRNFTICRWNFTICRWNFTNFR
jgi:hypothetical protein